jgi:hypothetical protein
MSQVDSQYVKRGIWTNLDEGPIMGRTITTDSSTGFLLVALLAVLSTLGRQICAIIPPGAHYYPT